jgi:hypothetical protein
MKGLGVRCLQKTGRWDASGCSVRKKALSTGLPVAKCSPSCPTQAADRSASRTCKDRQMQCTVCWYHQYAATEHSCRTRFVCIAANLVGVPVAYRPVRWSLHLSRQLSVCLSVQCAQRSTFRLFICLSFCLSVLSLPSALRTMAGQMPAAYSSARVSQRCSQTLGRYSWNTYREGPAQAPASPCAAARTAGGWMGGWERTVKQSTTACMGVWLSEWTG